MIIPPSANSSPVKTKAISFLVVSPRTMALKESVITFLFCVKPEKEMTRQQLTENMILFILPAQNTPAA
jgi:hypothetical protein